MEFLHMLENIRTPFLNRLMLLVTNLGDETVLLVLALLVCWCLSKRVGYRIITTCFFALGITILTKVLCSVPRPWVLDGTLTPVEQALERAKDFSFPSGHSTIAAALYVGLMLQVKKPLGRVLLLLTALAVVFSRMYLGVHTPADVTVGFAIGTACAVIVRLLQEKMEKHFRLVACVELALTVFLLVSLLIQSGRTFDAEDSYAVATARTSLEDTSSLLGASVAFLLSHLLDERRTHFDTKAVWWVQLLKLIIGGAVTMGIRLGLKAVLPDEVWARALRYFCMMAFAAGIWPVTFAWWKQLGKRAAKQ